MGRDLTPKEMYSMEQQIKNGGLGSLWDFMEHLTVTNDGVTSHRYSSDDLAKRKQNPLLGRLFEPYDDLYSFLSQLPGGLELLSRYEEELDNYIKTGKGDRNSALIKWFEGELDPNFYHQEINNELFFASVQDEVKVMSVFGLNHRSLDDQISSAASLQADLHATFDNSSKQISPDRPMSSCSIDKEHTNDER